MSSHIIRGVTISNERISFTSFVSRALPAATRWNERELAVLGAAVQDGYVPTLAPLSKRQQLTQLVLQYAEVLVQAPRLQSNHQMVRRMDHFNQPLVVWRLISGNHRELGRGVGLFPDYAAAAAHARSVQRAVGELTITFVQSQPAREFGWYASLRGRPVLTASSWYPTIRERDRSAAAALDLLGAARLLETVIRHGHRHLSVELSSEQVGPRDAVEGPVPEDPLPALSP
ncbi:hypothetical protein GCM10023063_43230 [Arthrobacter methylotrophus]|uniref:Uncharacterized protein n=1 Tax=Arthrobacter methylotrophus TaxID=121291 RepID=A0ABV5UMV0_9MICC